MLVFRQLFQSGPPHFTHLGISTKSGSNRFPRRAGPGVIFETGQLFVFSVCPWMEPWRIVTWLNGPVDGFTCGQLVVEVPGGGVGAGTGLVVVVVEATVVDVFVVRYLGGNSSSESSELGTGGGLLAATGSGGGSAADSGAEESTRCFFFGSGVSTG